MNFPSKFSALFLPFLLIVASPVTAEETAKVNATVIVASNQGADFDLDNDAYRDRLIQLFSYTYYHQLDTKSFQLAKSERVKLSLPEGYELVLTLQGREKKRILVQAVIRQGNRSFVDTVLSVASPGVAFLGGPSLTEGTLIIVLETGF